MHMTKEPLTLRVLFICDTHVVNYLFSTYENHFIRKKVLQLYFAGHIIAITRKHITGSVLIPGAGGGFERARLLKGCSSRFIP